MLAVEKQRVKGLKKRRLGQAGRETIIGSLLTALHLQGSGIARPALGLDKLLFTLLSNRDEPGGGPKAFGAFVELERPGQERDSKRQRTVQ